MAIATQTISIHAITIHAITMFAMTIHAITICAMTIHAITIYAIGHAWMMFMRNGPRTMTDASSMSA